MPKDNDSQVLVLSLAPLTHFIFQMAEEEVTTKELLDIQSCDILGYNLAQSDHFLFKQQSQFKE